MYLNQNKEIHVNKETSMREREKAFKRKEKQQK
jgi:hypothetical protein